MRLNSTVNYFNLVKSAPLTERRTRPMAIDDQPESCEKTFSIPARKSASPDAPIMAENI